MQTLLFTLGAVVVGTSFVLGLWFAGQAAVDRRRLKNLWAEYEGLHDKEDRLREYLDLHKKDQAEIKELREFIEHLMTHSGALSDVLDDEAGKIRARMRDHVGQLEKIPTDPPPPDCP